MNDDDAAAIEVLRGGFWSSAFGIRAGEDELVLRIGTMRDGFEADRFAMRWSSDALPVPEVYAVGDLPGGRAYAISRRHHGRFLEDVLPGEVELTRPMLRSLLDALRTTPVSDGETIGSWREWLLAGLADDADHVTGGWRTKLRTHGDADRLFDVLDARIRSLVEACPERTDLVHGDLLHKNVLVSDDASRVEAVFSWKCSTRGDALFDVAWCTFWGETFHPGIAAIDVWSLVDHDDEDAALRHHCYELHIGATHLGWYAWTDDPSSMARIAGHLAMLVERGPRR